MQDAVLHLVSTDASVVASFHLHAALRDDRRPVLALALEEGGELGAASWCTTSAPCETRRSRTSGERMMRVSSVGERWRPRPAACSPASSTPLPGAGLEALDALLGDRRHVRQQRHARGLRHAEHLQLAGLHVRQRRQHAVHQHLRLAGDGVADRLRAALVRDVLPTWRLVAFSTATPARCGALPMAVTAKFSLLLLRQRHQLLQVVRRHRRVHHEQVRRVGQHRHAAQVLRRIERQLVVDRRA